MNRYGDPFLILPDGAVAMRDVGAGALTKVARDVADFDAQLGNGEAPISG